MCFEAKLRGHVALLERTILKDEMCETLPLTWVAPTHQTLEGFLPLEETDLPIR